LSFNTPIIFSSPQHFDVSETRERAESVVGAAKEQKKAKSFTIVTEKSLSLNEKV